MQQSSATPKKRDVGRGVKGEEGGGEREGGGGRGTAEERGGGEGKGRGKAY